MIPINRRNYIALEQSPVGHTHSVRIHTGPLRVVLVSHFLRGRHIMSTRQHK